MNLSNTPSTRSPQGESSRLTAKPALLASPPAINPPKIFGDMSTASVIGLYSLHAGSADATWIVEQTRQALASRKAPQELCVLMENGSPASARWPRDHIGAVTFVTNIVNRLPKQNPYHKNPLALVRDLTADKIPELCLYPFQPEFRSGGPHTISAPMPIRELASTVTHSSSREFWQSLVEQLKDLSRTYPGMLVWQEQPKIEPSLRRLAARFAASAAEYSLSSGSAEMALILKGIEIRAKFLNLKDRDDAVAQQAARWVNAKSDRLIFIPRGADHHTFLEESLRPHGVSHAAAVAEWENLDDGFKLYQVANRALCDDPAALRKLAAEMLFAEATMDIERTSSDGMFDVSTRLANRSRVVTGIQRRPEFCAEKWLLEHASQFDDEGKSLARLARQKAAELGISLPKY